MRFPVVYDGNEVDFSHYGLGVLNKAVECSVTEELNGSFECNIAYPANIRLADCIKEEDVIKVNASYNLKNQLFRVYKISKNLEGKYNAYCQHITYDLVDDFVEVADYKSISLSTALQRMIDDSLFCQRFRAHTDIREAKDIFIQHSNLFNAINGGNGSLLDTWGQFDLLRDNFDIHMLNKRGQDKGQLFHEGKNIISLDFELDYTNLCTVIYPYAKIKEEWNGFDKTIKLPEKYIYSPLHENYKKKYIKPIDFTSDKVRNVDDLRREASKYFMRNRVDIPINNLKFKIINEKVGLGDTIIARIPRLDIDVSLRVVKLKFNPILNEIEDLELGDLKKIKWKGVI